jgi:hypothetical protein
MGAGRAGCLAAATFAAVVAAVLAALAAIVVGIGVIGSTGENRSAGDSRPAATRPAAPAPEPATRRPTVTRAQYDLVTDGMPYSGVRAIIGTDGEEMSRATFAGMTSVVYTWKNRDGSNMVATFQDDRLVTKAQFGLQ